MDPNNVNPLRHLSLFNPRDFEEIPIHIIGDNLVAKQAAYLIAKLGCSQIVLWGEDTTAQQEIADYVHYFTGVNLEIKDRNDITPDIYGVVLVAETSLQKRVELYQNCLEMAADVMQVVETRTYNGDLPKVVTVSPAELFMQTALYDPTKDQASWDNAVLCPLRSRIAAIYMVTQFIVWSQITFKLEGKEGRKIAIEQFIAGMAGLDAPTIAKVSLLSDEHKSLPIHVIGVGATGSHLVALLAECGFTNIMVYDFDKIEPHNIANQWFSIDQIGEFKTHALAENIRKFYGYRIRLSDVRVGKNSDALEGIIFLLTDTMESRKEIADALLQKDTIPLIVETRMSSEISQIYVTNQIDYAIWRASLFDTNVYKPEVSACGTSITIATTAKLCVVVAVSEAIDYLTGGDVTYSSTTSAYPPHMTNV